MLSFIINKIKWKRFIKEWRRHNNHNSTIPECSFDPQNVNVGNFTYGNLYVLNYGNDAKLKIGSFCSIASRVIFVLNADHPIHRVSTFPFKAKVLYVQEHEASSKGDIIIEDDVWIGQNAIILSGVHIGQGAVVAAGAVVSSDVPSYSIVGGVPAKVIKYRFDPECIKFMEKIDYSKITREMIEAHIEDLYKDASEANTSWLPLKEEQG